jgi:7-cyano-7-deazaguanine reductase|tara:strand:- start:553 stop:1260 length:708 start_codon:yes stop_codon:yes gene_type:complete
LAGLLGKKVSNPKEFSPEILFPIERQEQRKHLNNSDFKGEDIWNIHELLWIDNNDCHHHNEISIVIPCSSANIVESKSLKLFINSLVHKRFKSLSEVNRLIKHHIDELVEADIEINNVYKKPDAKVLSVMRGKEINHSPESASVSELFCFKGFRSLCPVTQQPDIADIFIEASLSETDQDNIANYLGSFFEKEAFHELCVEQIFEDLKSFNYLFSMVEGYFERRGGIAIIPRRYS